MMQTASPMCPSKAQWQALLVGMLPGDVIKVMEAHLDNCSNCAATLAELTPATPLILRMAARTDRQTAPSEDLWYMRLRSAMRSGEGTIDFSTDEDVETTVRTLTHVGDYKLGELIGRGGMGLVYRAQQVRLKRDVAIKMLRRLGRSSAATQRLITEAQRLAHIKHPNIVQVIDAGEQDGVPYFSMELVEGRSLAKAIRTAPFSARRAAELVRTVAEAIQAAHDVGVIHRDLKPANILLQDVEVGPSDDSSQTHSTLPHSRMVKISDFGLGTTREEILSGTVAIAGTAEYMAPEQWTCDPELISPRTDVYGLGAILYELLTGRPPFPRDADPEITCERVLCEAPTPPRRIRPEVPRDLEAICMRCLEKNPGRRYASARAVAKDIGKYLDHRPIAARPTSVSRRAAYFCRRHWAPLTAAAAAVVVLCTVGIPYGLAIRNDHLTAEADLQFKDGLRTASEGRFDESVKQIRKAIEILPANKTALNRYYQQTAARLDATSPRRIGACPHNSVITTATLSPSGDRVLFGDRAGGTWLWFPSDNSVRRLEADSNTRFVHRVAFDSTGALCAAAYQNGLVRVWNAETRALVAERDLDGPEVNGIAFLGKDGAFVTGSNNLDSPLRMWSTSGSFAANVTIPPENINNSTASIVGSPDGNSFVAMFADGRCQQFDQSGRLLYDSFSRSKEPVEILAYSSDSRRVLMVDAGNPPASGASVGNRVYVCQPATGEVSELLCLKPGLRVKGAVFRPDGGTTLALGRSGGTIIRSVTADGKAWEDHPLDPGEPSVHLGPGGEVWALNGRNSNTLSLAAIPPLLRRGDSIGIDASLGFVAALSDGKRFVTMARKNGSFQRLVQIQWHDCESMALIGEQVFSDDGFMPISAAANPSKTQLALNQLALGCESVGQTPGAVLLGDITDNSGIRIHCLGNHRATACALAFSPDGQRLFSGCIGGPDSNNGELASWNVATRSLERKEDYPTSVNHLLPSPDGQFLAVADSEGCVSLVPSETLKPADSATFSAGSPVTALAFSTDGKHLGIGTLQGRLFVCRVNHGQLSLDVELEPGSGRVPRIAFAKNAPVMLATTTAPDFGVHIWNTEVWRRVASPLGAPGQVLDFAFVAGRNEIMTLTTDGCLSAIPIAGLK